MCRDSYEVCTSQLDQVLDFLEDPEICTKHPVLNLADFESCESRVQFDVERVEGLELVTDAPAAPHYPSSLVPLSSPLLSSPRTGCGGAGSEARRCAPGAGEE